MRIRTPIVISPFGILTHTARPIMSRTRIRLYILGTLLNGGLRSKWLLEAARVFRSSVGQIASHPSRGSQDRDFPGAPQPFMRGHDADFLTPPSHGLYVTRCEFGRPADATMTFAYRKPRLGRRAHALRRRRSGAVRAGWSWDHCRPFGSDFQPLTRKSSELPTGNLEATDSTLVLLTSAITSLVHG